VAGCKDAIRVNSKETDARRGGETGRRTGLKIPGPDRDVWVRFPPPASTPAHNDGAGVERLSHFSVMEIHR
jgi:hypothetical protein